MEFLNEQMERAEVLAVEIKQFVAEGFRTMIPKIIGLTAAAEQAKGRQAKTTFAEQVDAASADRAGVRTARA